MPRASCSLSSAQSGGEGLGEEALRNHATARRFRAPLAPALSSFVRHGAGETEAILVSVVPAGTLAPLENGEQNRGRIHPKNRRGEETRNTQNTRKQRLRMCFYEIAKPHPPGQPRACDNAFSFRVFSVFRGFNCFSQIHFLGGSLAAADSASFRRRGSLDGSATRRS